MLPRSNPDIDARESLHINSLGRGGLSWHPVINSPRAFNTAQTPPPSHLTPNINRNRTSTSQLALTFFHACCFLYSTILLSLIPIIISDATTLGLSSGHVCYYLHYYCHYLQCNYYFDFY